MRVTRYLGIAAAAAGFALATFVTGAAFAAELSPAAKELAAAADKEGSLTIMWGEERSAGSRG